MNDTHPLITRRRFLGSAGLIGAGGLLSACGPFAGGSDDNGRRLELLNANWGDIYNQAIKKIGNSYTNQHPKVSLQWTFVTDWQTKLLTDIAGKTPPDATYTSWNAQASLASGNQLMPLDDYVKSAGLSRGDFIGPVYDTCVWDNHLYALPGGADFLVLFWSKDLYRDVGLDPEKPPTTADELIAHSKEVLKKDSGGKILRLGYNPTAADFIQWAFIFGGSFFDAEKQKVTANHPANVDALSWMYKYVKLLDVNKLASFSNQPSYSEPGNPFATKQSAYLFSGFWTYDAMDKYAPDIDYGVAFWPTVHGAKEERTNYLLQGWQYAIPRGVKKPDASWQFMKYAFITKSAQMGYQTLNGPCLIKALPEFTHGLRSSIGAKNRMTPYLDVFTETARAGTKHWPVMKVNSYYSDQITSTYDFVMRGKMTPQDGLNQVTANVQKKLDQK